MFPFILFGYKNDLVALKHVNFLYIIPLKEWSYLILVYCYDENNEFFFITWIRLRYDQLSMVQLSLSVSTSRNLPRVCVKDRVPISRCCPGIRTLLYADWRTAASCSSLIGGNVSEGSMAFGISEVSDHHLGYHSQENQWKLTKHCSFRIKIQYNLCFKVV